MTPERKAELHRLAEACLDGRDSGTRIANAIPALLDELEALTEFSQIASDACNNLRTERDSLAAQVVRLREALEAAEREVWAWQAGADAYGATSLTDYHPPEFEPSALLADTEAAAKTWLEADRREQRLAGARELHRRLMGGEIRAEGSKRIHMLDVGAKRAASEELEAMEREQ